MGGWVGAVVGRRQMRADGGGAQSAAHSGRFGLARENPQALDWLQKPETGAVEDQGR